MPLMSFLFNRKECILSNLKVHHYIKYEQDHLFSYCIGLVVMTHLLILIPLAPTESSIAHLLLWYVLHLALFDIWS